MNAEALKALIQSGYYDAVDRGDMAAAAGLFTDDVDWSHVQVWAHDRHARGDRATLRGRPAVEAFLTERVDTLRAARITHHVDRLVFDGQAGAFIGHVAGPHGARAPFMAWIEVAGDRLSRYSLRPL